MADWDNEPLLGKVHDTTLAKKHGVSEVAVGRARRRRGIPPFKPKGYGENDRPMGHRAGIDWDKQPLGKVPDCDLAKDLGVDAASVKSARNVRGIPRYYKKLGKVVDWDSEPQLGKVPDVELANELGVHRRTVANARERRGIPKLESHVHKCPICFKLTECHLNDCEPKLETSDGTPMLYETCEYCLKEFEKEENRGEVGIITTHFNHGRR